MKQKLIIIFCLTTLLTGSLFLRSRSSYAVFVAAGEADLGIKTAADASENEIPPADTGDAPLASDADGDRSLEDIALDKRIAAQKAANERSYKESGIVSSLPPEMPVPRFDINELTDMIFNTVYVYMEENPDRFPAPDEYELLIQQSFDPRIHALMYGETKAGLLSGFESGNLAAWDVKQSDGGYTILILARDAAGGQWRVLTEGNVYKLRMELAD